MKRRQLLQVPDRFVLQTLVIPESPEGIDTSAIGLLGSFCSIPFVASPEIIGDLFVAPVLQDRQEGLELISFVTLMITMSL